MNPSICRKILTLGILGLPLVGRAQPAPPPITTLRVAAIQMRSEGGVRANVAKITKHLAECAARGVKVVAFPECAVSGYSREEVNACTVDDLATAEKNLADACRTSHINAIIGLPQRRDGRIFNQALIINDQGQIVARYNKVYLTGEEARWPFIPGSELPPVFSLGGVPASLMICHDSRFPELTRLPVLAGARVIFYISHEAFILKESKMVPYRAQVQARAVENDVFVVHANAPANDIRSGSHGQSRIVGADGNIMQEAGQLQEEVLVADLNVADATASRPVESLDGPFGDWWREGMKRVPVIK